MRLQIVNPNTTASMTRKIEAAPRSVARPDTEVVAVNPEYGPASIEGYYDEAFSLPGLLDEIGRAPTPTLSSSPVSTTLGWRPRVARPPRR